MLNLWRALPEAKIDIVRLSINGNSSASYKLPGLQRCHHHRHDRVSIFPLKPSKPLKINRNQGICQALRSEDAPFIIAIGACVLSSLVYAKKEEATNHNPKGSPLGTDDVRNGAMTIISFIPIFNWLCWIFAWLDTSEQRYLLYASVYLAPYVRSGFSFSADENWLLILSYAACIAHIQIEMGIQMGTIELNLDGLKRLGNKETPEIPGTSSPPKEGFQNPLVEQDLSEIELLEFDKKLSRKRNDATISSTDSSPDEKNSKEDDTEDSDKLSKGFYAYIFCIF